jgi:16S rRNA (guanine966-N2)-methyltransferase
MRISGGDARGIRLKVPKGARPASEKVRQAIFSSLQHHVLDARVLDLYCGSGAYGLEALSRGASSAVFVDTDTDACRSNLTQSGFADVGRTRRTSVDRYMGRAKGDGPFDLVFVDPPYASGGVQGRLLDAIAPVLAEGGRVVWESRWRSEATEMPVGWLVEADRRYGDTRVTILTRGATG